MFVLALALSVTAPPAHDDWDRMLARHVTPQARVDYSAWKKSGTGELDRYLETLAAPWPAAAMPSQARKAALINAYNALVVRWILGNYPVESIWKTANPFREPRHTVDGRIVSLDQIENELRELGDPRVHAVLVCAARSCPPLRREAYRAGRLDEQMDDNTRIWLANAELNKFDTSRLKAEVSSIFHWFAADFQRNGGTVREFLARFAPPPAQPMLREGVVIRYKTYQWGLNDTGRVGENYGGVSLWWNVLKNKF